jgi:5-methylcytosine-specific restriction endonuclease McrA
MDYKVLLIIGVLIVLILLRWLLDKKGHERRTHYYRNEYLLSEEWKRKRYLVLKRDNWRCVYCGQPATQVHHLKYSKRHIGSEPINWLVSVCKLCHQKKHKGRISPVLSNDDIKWNFGFDQDTIHFRDWNKNK